MPRALARDSIYRGDLFSQEIIERYVGWYVACRLRYRDHYAGWRKGDSGVSYDDPALGAEVPVRMRAPMGALRAR